MEPQDGRVIVQLSMASRARTRPRVHGTLQPAVFAVRRRFPTLPRAPLLPNLFAELAADDEPVHESLGARQLKSAGHHRYDERRASCALASERTT